MVERLRQFPREPDLLVYGLRIAAAVLLRAWMRTYHRLTSSGGRTFRGKARTSLWQTTPATSTRRRFSPRCRWGNSTAFSRGGERFLLRRACHARRSPRLWSTPCRSTATTTFAKAWVCAARCWTTRQHPPDLSRGNPQHNRRNRRVSAGHLPCCWPAAICRWCRATSRGRSTPGRRELTLPRPRKVRLVIGHPRRYTAPERGKESAEVICQDLREAVLALAPLGRFDN